MSKAFTAGSVVIVLLNAPCIAVSAGPSKQEQTKNLIRAIVTDVNDGCPIINKDNVKLNLIRLLVQAHLVPTKVQNYSCEDISSFIDFQKRFKADKVFDIQTLKDQVLEQAPRLDLSKVQAAFPTARSAKNQ